MLNIRRSSRYLAESDLKIDTEKTQLVVKESLDGENYFPQFLEEQKVTRLNGLLQNKFFKSCKDSHNRRFGLCEENPLERTIIVDAMAASLNLKLEEIGLS